jgi:hypothetical protein
MYGIIGTHSLQNANPHASPTTLAFHDAALLMPMPYLQWPLLMWGLAVYLVDAHAVAQWCPPVMLLLQDIDSHDRALEEREAKLDAVQAQLAATEAEVAAKAAAVADADKRLKVGCASQLQPQTTYHSFEAACRIWTSSQHCTQ